MKHIIPVVSNNTTNVSIEFFLEDDNSDEAETVTLALRSTEDQLPADETDPSIFTTVKTDNLLKALEWLKRWSHRGDH